MTIEEAAPRAARSAIGAFMRIPVHQVNRGGSRTSTCRCDLVVAALRRNHAIVLARTRDTFKHDLELRTYLSASGRTPNLLRRTFAAHPESRPHALTVVRDQVGMALNQRPNVSPHRRAVEPVDKGKHSRVDRGGLVTEDELLLPKHRRQRVDVLARALQDCGVVVTAGALRVEQLFDRAPRHRRDQKAQRTGLIAKIGLTNLGPVGVDHPAAVTERVVEMVLAGTLNQKRLGALLGA